MTTASTATEVFLAAAVPVTGAPAAPASAPAVTVVASGSQSARFEWVKVTLVNAIGESYPSAETVIQVPANYVILVSAPGVPGGDYPGKPTTWNVYVTTAGSGNETKQNTVGIPTGDNPTQKQTWQEPSTGLIAGSSLPTAVAANPALTAGNSNLANTPPVTGALAPPQAPAGTSNTNTGRSLSATASYLAASLNVLNVGTTPPSNAGTT